MKINCIAVDDEPPALMQMEDYISQVPFLNLMGTFDNGISALEFLKNNDINLLFLDIEMEGITGLQLLNILKNKPYVILTTAYDQYALQAFDLDVSDYLLKPFPFERFLQAVEKIYDHMSSKKVTIINPQSPTSKDEQDYLFVKTEYRMQRVDLKDILYIEGLKEYIIIKTITGRVITLQSFKHLEEALPPERFARVHKSYMVAVDKIEYVEKNRIKIADKLIPVGETYKKVFTDLLEKRGL